MSKKLSKPIDVEDFIKQRGQNKSKLSAIDELIDISESDPIVLKIMIENNANRETLKTLYDKLTIFGAGQYADGHFVAASSLAYPLTLEYLLSHFDGENFKIDNLDAKNSGMKIAYRLIMYFEKGETGKVV